MRLSDYFLHSGQSVDFRIYIRMHRIELSAVALEFPCSELCFLQFTVTIRIDYSLYTVLNQSTAVACVLIHQTSLKVQKNIVVANFHRKNGSRLVN